MGYFSRVGMGFNGIGLGFNRQLTSTSVSCQHSKEDIICNIGNFCQNKTLFTLTPSDRGEIKCKMNQLNERRRYSFFTTETTSFIYCAVLLYVHFKRNIPTELQVVRNFLQKEFNIDCIANYEESFWSYSEQYFQQIVGYLHNSMQGNYQRRNSYGGEQEQDFARIVHSFGEIPTRYEVAQINCMRLDYKLGLSHDILFLSVDRITDCLLVGLSTHLNFLKTHKSDLGLCDAEMSNLNTAFYAFKNVLPDLEVYTMSKYEFYIFELLFFLIECYKCKPSERISRLIQSAANEINRNDIANRLFNSMLEGCNDDTRTSLEYMLLPRFELSLEETRLSLLSASESLEV